MALSVASYGKILSYVAIREKISEGWDLNRSGKPTTAPKEVADGYLLPIRGY